MNSEITHARWPIRRFEVTEESMTPTLHPGDVIVAIRTRSPAIGSIVVFPHPRMPWMWLVKRVTNADGQEAWVESDNPALTMADSRTLGWISTEVMYRSIVVIKFPLRLRGLRMPRPTAS